MKRERCKRQLAEGEPVYRALWACRWYMACAKCNDAQKVSRNWLPPFQCSHCSRPVIRTTPPRKGTRYFACGIECRQAMHNANYRRWHPRSRIEQQCPSCGKVFTPKRSDTIHCSTACKQRAYRRAHRGEVIDLDPASSEQAKEPVT
jgi:hypothetical protein